MRCPRIPKPTRRRGASRAAPGGGEIGWFRARPRGKAPPRGQGGPGRPKHSAEDEAFGKALVPAGALTTFGLLAKSLEPRQTRS